MARYPFTRHACVALALWSAAAGSSRGEDIYAITDTSTLLRFDSATPGSVTTIGPVTGVTVGTLQSIDFRPATGTLYGLGYDPATNFAQLYTIDRTTGAATAVGGSITLTGSGAALRAAIDFNPVADLVRVVTTSATNYRVDPNTGALVGTDTNLAYAAGDPNVPSNPPFVPAIAYSNNSALATATTLYAYDFDIDVLARIGSVGGTPDSPNSGQLFTVGASGVAAFSSTMGLDISGPTGTAYLNANVGGPDDNFYTVNLGTGTVTLVGQIGDGLEILDIAAPIAAVPEPASLALGGLGALGAAYVLRRHRRRARRHPARG